MLSGELVDLPRVLQNLPTKYLPGERSRCLTTEVIMEFAFAKSANMLEEHETTFESWFLVAFDAVAGSLWKMQEFPLLRKVAGHLPDKLVASLDPQLVNVFRMLKVPFLCPTYLHMSLCLLDRDLVTNRNPSPSSMRKAVSTITKATAIPLHTRSCSITSPPYPTNTRSQRLWIF
jgi:hypothetical protein